MKKETILREQIQRQVMQRNGTHKMLVRVTGANGSDLHV